MQSVPASAGAGIVKRNLQVIVAEEPVKRCPRIFQPLALSGRTISLQACRYTGTCFDGLLVESGFLRFFRIKSVRSDRNEMALSLATLNGRQPVQCFKPGRNHCVVSVARTRSYERLRKSSIRVRKFVFEPVPIIRTAGAVRVQQPVR